MQLPHFLSVKRVGRLSRRDEKVFTEASRLAMLRLEQCVADLRMAGSATGNTMRTQAASATEQRKGPRPELFPESADRHYVPIPVLSNHRMPEASGDIINCLRASSGRPMRIKFSDGVVQTVIIGTVDREGFLHCGIGVADQVFWTRFEDVHALEAEN